MKLKIIALIFSLTSLFNVGMPAATFAQDVCSGPQSDSAYCTGKDVAGNPLFGPDGIATKLVRILSLAVGVISIFIMIYAGLRFVMSGGDSQKINQARNTILYAAIGIGIAMLSQAIVIFILKKV